MNSYYLAAAIVVSLTTAFHCIIGGRRVVRPMLASADMNDTVKAVLYGCWHAFTVLYAGVAFGFLWAAFSPEARALAQVNTTLAGLLAVFSVGVILPFGQKLGRLPHWLLFGAAALLGLFGTCAA